MELLIKKREADKIENTEEVLTYSSTPLFITAFIKTVYLSSYTIHHALQYLFIYIATVHVSTKAATPFHKQNS